MKSQKTNNISGEGSVKPKKASKNMPSPFESQSDQESSRAISERDMVVK